ncbi:hypothetical protein BD410DRAFT_800309 [Rickenella mellea]|uniref:Uncharacterized protein n=1 Tax=Rickenella mellea TaxID=50990 RepID=A0A4Y7QFN1_9AGAM|nr:hypothetical protein BD410DRAFT_800309 [Rickenella mellea]
MSSILFYKQGPDTKFTIRVVGVVPNVAPQRRRRQTAARKGKFVVVEPQTPPPRTNIWNDRGRRSSRSRRTRNLRDGRLEECSPDGGWLRDIGASLAVIKSPIWNVRRAYCRLTIASSGLSASHPHSAGIAPAILSGKLFDVALSGARGRATFVLDSGLSYTTTPPSPPRLHVADDAPHDLLMAIAVSSRRCLVCVLLTSQHPTAKERKRRHKRSRVNIDPPRNTLPLNRTMISANPFAIEKQECRYRRSRDRWHQ